MIIFGRSVRLTGMEREKTGAELLLSEPEIVAWLGLDDKHGASACQAQWQARKRPSASAATSSVPRRAPARAPTVRAQGFGMAL